MELKKNIPKIISTLRNENTKFDVPSVTQVSHRSKDPFHVLVSCLISLRTKDQVTMPASQRLFRLAQNPKKMAGLSVKQIEKAIYPAGFYKTKAKRIKDICNILNNKYDGKVPNDLDELLKLHGVGRKTANLVITLGYNKLGICVDTHVHRISNRLGLVKTRNPNETEFKLREILPKKHWIEYNDLLVTYGQNICRPISPFCGKCRIRDYCRRIGVESFR